MWPHKTGRDEERAVTFAVLADQIDRLLGWEVFRAFSTGNWSVAMESTDFCDRIGLNKNYPNVVVDRVRRKMTRDQNE